MNFCFLVFFSHQVAAETAAESTAEPASEFFLLNSMELSSFNPERKDQYLKEVAKVLQANQKLPQASLQELKSKVDLVEPWSAFEESVISTCTSKKSKAAAVKKSCQRLKEIRVAALTAGAAGRTEPHLKKSKSY